MKYKYKKKTKKAKKEGWSETVLYIFLGFMIAYFLNIGLGLAFDTNTPVVAVFSESMVPTFEKGDMIIVHGIEGGVTGMATSVDKKWDLEEGDIIIFDVPQYKYPLIHRIVSIDENGEMTTKGDNNAYSDPWKVTKEDVHGKAVLRMPYLGWVKVGTFEILGLA